MAEEEAVGEGHENAACYHAAFRDEVMMELRQRIEADMRAARLARDRQTDVALRSIIQAFDNASAVQTDDINRATYGLGGDIARRALTDDDLRAVLSSLIDERMDSARVLEAHGQQAEADTLGEEVGIMRRYLT